MGQVAEMLFGRNKIDAVKALLDREVSEHDEMRLDVITRNRQLERKTESVNRLLKEAAAYGIVFDVAGRTSFRGLVETDVTLVDVVDEEPGV